jgi:transaldolase
MRTFNLKTKIFLDSGDPKETREILGVLGFLDGQTTNPSLIAKNPQTLGKKFSKEEIFEFYQGVVKEISNLIPDGSVSVEVYADASTSSSEMIEQAREFYKWISPHPALSPEGRGGGGAHIKFPTTSEGLKAAEIAVKEGMRVNMTLVFSQEQAAAVYASTKGASRGQVYLSPFVGRLDDIGQNGMDLISNIIKMYKKGDGHVEVLSASIRSIEHLVKSFELGSGIITAPGKILKEWAALGLPNASEKLKVESQKLEPIPYLEINLDKPWQEYDIHHELTDKGIERFAKDWNGLIK